MKRFILLLAAVMAMAAPAGQPASAQYNQWTEISRDAKGGIYYMRPRDIANGSNWNPEIWVKGYHEADKSVLYRSSMTHYAIDCDAYQYALIEGIYYHADGRVRSRKAGSRKNIRTIVPDSVMDTIAANACP